MKKVFIILGISLVVAACGGKKPGESAGGADSVNNITAVTSNSNAAQDTSVNKIGTGTTAAAGAESKGQTLMASLDCMTCHNEKTKIIGPAFIDIAKKYTDKDVETLAKKVISGGSGNWGTVPMTAHPDLKLADAEEMVKYILTVK